MENAGTAKILAARGVTLSPSHRAHNARLEQKQEQERIAIVRKEALPVGASVVARWEPGDGRELVFFSSGHVLYRAAPPPSVFKQWQNFRAFHDKYYADAIDRLSQGRNPKDQEECWAIMREQQKLLRFFKTEVKPFLDSNVK